MGVKEKKINMLLALFSEKEVITVEEIKEKLNIKDRSVKSYIGYLRDYGINVVPMNKKYKIISGQITGGILLNNEDLRIIKTILTVGENNGKFTRKELVDEICTSLCDEESISRKTIERAIKVCVQNNYIYLDEKNKYRVSLGTDTFHLTNDEEVFEFMEACSIYGDHIPFYNEVNNLKSKIMEQTGYEEMDCSIYCIGRGYSCDDALKDTIRQFEDYDYRKRALEIRYTSKAGDKTVLMQTVTLLYNWENDKSYVIGLVGNKIYFINVKTILDIRETEFTNKYYNDSHIMKKLDLMFGSSLDGPYEVKVEFEDIFNINEKLLRLHKNRKNSSLTKIGDKIIYTDTVYGIYDFARYLRGFGSSCRVLEPQELRNIMRKTYERILNNYGEL